MNVAIMPNYVKIALERVTALALFANAFYRLKSMVNIKKVLQGILRAVAQAWKGSRENTGAFCQSKKLDFTCVGITQLNYNVIFIVSMGCNKLTYRNFSFLEVVHRKNATDFKKNRLNGDHLGNIRLSYKEVNGSLQIQEENNYYPFGLEHKGYNESTLQEYNYKQYQGQEFTKELGLDIHEWKYRISDPAIGRFWQVDPLAEDYYYNSVYAFQENKMGMGVELEGLELSSQRSNDGKSITLIYRVNPVNNTKATDGTNMLNKGNFNKLINARAKQFEKTMNGSTTDGAMVNTKVVFDKDATVKWEYNGMIDTEGVDDPSLQSADGKTSTVGDTQNNRTQVNMNAASDLDENFEYDVTEEAVKNATRTGVHEDLHVGGNKHGDKIENNPTLKKKVNNNRNNSMYGDGRYGGNEINEEQRTEIINNTQNQQPNNQTP